MTDIHEIDMDEMRVQDIKKLQYYDYFVDHTNLENFKLNHSKNSKKYRWNKGVRYWKIIKLELFCGLNKFGEFWTQSLKKL